MITEHNTFYFLVIGEFLQLKYPKDVTGLCLIHTHTHTQETGWANNFLKAAHEKLGRWDWTDR